MDCIRGEAIVTACDRPSLRNATFLDGREKFWQAEKLIPLVPMGRGPSPASRFIFHTGFAGSTLLARLLEDSGSVLTLKEPHCLADIAGQRGVIATGDAIAPLDVLVDHAVGRLGDLGGEDVPVLVKPTNWANCILRELCKPERGVRAVFVSMPIRDYLLAVFRGGTERLGFCARLAADLALLSPDSARAMNAAASCGGDATDQVARFIALLHWMQEREFGLAIAANGWDESVRIDFHDIVEKPLRTSARARRALDLPKVPKDRPAVARLMERHAKDGSRSFSRRAEAEANSTVERHHGARIDAAIDWLAGQNLPR